MIFLLCWEVEHIQTALVAAALKGVFHKRVHNGLGQFNAGYARSEAEYVGVIVLACHARVQFCGAEGGADIGMTVWRQWKRPGPCRR